MKSKLLKSYIPFYGIYYLFKKNGDNLINLYENDFINYILTAIIQALYVCTCFYFIFILFN